MEWFGINHYSQKKKKLKYLDYLVQKNLKMQKIQKHRLNVLKINTSGDQIKMIYKLIDRLNEINGGSYEIEDMITDHLKLLID